MHAGHAETPRGLTDLLTSMHSELLAHMEKEETILFPMLAQFGVDPVQLSDVYSLTITAHVFESPLDYDPLARPFLIRPGTALAIMNGYASRWPETPRGPELDRVPSLILWGGADDWVKPEVADRLQAALPRARRVMLEGAGHLPMETHLAPTRDALLAHFAGPPPVARLR